MMYIRLDELKTYSYTIDYIACLVFLFVVNKLEGIVKKRKRSKRRSDHIESERQRVKSDVHSGKDKTPLHENIE